MAKESVIYKGETFHLQSSGRYFQSGDRYADERLLHRRIYTDLFGPIPKGYCVHHKNSDWRDNNPENLECVLIRDHQKKHMEERLQDPEFRKKHAEYLLRARDKASEWHGSAEGRAWHSKHGKEVARNHKPVECVCKTCGKTFKAYQKTCEYCSRACMPSLSRGSYARQKTDPRVCKRCGISFLANKYRPVEFCTKKCSIYFRLGR